MSFLLKLTKILTLFDSEIWWKKSKDSERKTSFGKPSFNTKSLANVEKWRKPFFFLPLAAVSRSTGVRTRFLKSLHFRNDHDFVRIKKKLSTFNKIGSPLVSFAVDVFIVEILSTHTRTSTYIKHCHCTVLKRGFAVLGWHWMLNAVRAYKPPRSMERVCIVIDYMYIFISWTSHELPWIAKKTIGNSRVVCRAACAYASPCIRK